MYKNNQKKADRILGICVWSGAGLALGFLITAFVIGRIELLLGSLFSLPLTSIVYAILVRKYPSVGCYDGRYIE
jgi:hypothetical protein